MKLVSFDRLPRDGDATKFELVVENDGIKRKKLVVVSACAQSVLSVAQLRAETGWQIGKSLCELERDFAYDIFGKDWRLHVPRMWESEVAVRILQEIVDKHAEVINGAF